METVLFLHSTGTSPLMWSTVTAADIGGRTLIAPTNLGYDPFPALERPQTITVADEVAHVLSQLPAGDEPLHVVSHSYGGLVALNALPRIRHRLASLFFVEPITFGTIPKDDQTDPEAKASAKAFMDDPKFLYDDAYGGSEAWLEQFIDYWNRPGSWQRMPEALREWTKSVGWKMYQEVRQCFLADQPFASWELVVPTTMLIGERTTVASKAMSHGIARGRPNVTVVDVAGTGHMAPLTHPAKVNAEIARHFAKLEGKS